MSFASIISETLRLRCPRRVPSDVPNGDVTAGEGVVSVQTDVPTRLLESETLQSLNVCFHFLATDMQIQRPPEQQEFGQPG